jgi:hypothetical protein
LASSTFTINTSLNKSVIADFFLGGLIVPENIELANANYFLPSSSESNNEDTYSDMGNCHEYRTIHPQQRAIQSSLAFTC